MQNRQNPACIAGFFFVISQIRIRPGIVNMAWLTTKE